MLAVWLALLFSRVLVQAQGPRVSGIVNGGPAKDGIPSIDNPQFDPISFSSLPEESSVIGVFYSAEARAYPLNILNYHEIVNDKIAGLPVSVTFCPLCYSAAVYVRKVAGRETSFGTSGNLYQSCLVMYDRLTDSMWSQPWGVGVTGSQVNQELEVVPSVVTELWRWRQMHPESLVLNANTGYFKDYGSYPYGDYRESTRILFPAGNQESLGTLHPKAVVSYVARQSAGYNPLDAFGGESYSFPHLFMMGQNTKEFLFAGRRVIAQWDPNYKTLRFYDSSNMELPGRTAYAFAFAALFN